MAKQQRPWVDGPFDLIATPAKDKSSNPHAIYWGATEMTHSHNTIIRGLNAIYRQGSFVRQEQDVSDFLTFCTAWVKIVDHHHDAEEAVLFPELEKLTNNPDIMKENKSQHDAFHFGMGEFGKYLDETKPTQYRWEDAKARLDAFAPDLIMHLHEEISTLLGLKEYDSEGIRGVWKKTEDVAKGDIRLPGMFDTILPMVLGCVDKTYEGGIHKFPPFPFFFPYLVDYWFARKYRGAWRFCPCDMYGQPRPLAFVE